MVVIKQAKMKKIIICTFITGWALRAIEKRTVYGNMIGTI